MRRCFMALLIACVTVCDSAQASQSPPLAKRAWTVMVFMNGDNNLEHAALRDFKEMARVGGNADVTVVVQLDRIGKYSSSNEGVPIWTDTKRFVIQPGTRATPSEAIADLGEVNMGDPAALADFVRWARRSYPAERYVLVIWDHGQGYRDPTVAPSALNLPFRSALSAPHRSISYDETNGDRLYNSEVTSGLRLALGPDKLDVLGFDACLMAMMETAYAMREVARFMVGSEDLEPADGWNYTDVVTRLEADPGMSTADVARLLVRSYGHEYTNGPFLANPRTTQSAIDLSGVEDLASAVSSLGERLQTGLASHGDAILQARRECTEFAPGADPAHPEQVVFHHIDLGRFATRVAAVVPDDGIRQAAARVLSQLHTVVVENHAGDERQGAFGSMGLAIYFPIDGRAYATDPFEQHGYQRTNQEYPVAFVRDEKQKWVDFLHAYFERFPSIPR